MSSISCNRSCYGSLPTEMVGEVLGWLPEFGTTDKALSVCKKWNTILRNNLLKEIMEQADEIDCCDLKPFFHCSPALRRGMSAQLLDLVLCDMSKWKAGDSKCRDLTNCIYNSNILLALEWLSYLIAFNTIATEKQQFQVGDVVKHLLFREAGMVVRVHDHCKMPPQWIAANVGDINHPFIRERWYDILLDERCGGFIRHGAHRYHVAVNQDIMIDQPNFPFTFNKDSGRYELVEE